MCPGRGQPRHATPRPSHRCMRRVSVPSSAVSEAVFSGAANAHTHTPHTHTRTRQNSAHKQHRPKRNFLRAQTTHSSGRPQAAPPPLRRPHTRPCSHCLCTAVGRGFGRRTVPHTATKHCSGTAAAENTGAAVGQGAARRPGGPAALQKHCQTQCQAAAGRRRTGNTQTWDVRGNAYDERRNKIDGLSNVCCRLVKLYVFFSRVCVCVGGFGGFGAVGSAWRQFCDTVRLLLPNGLLFFVFRCVADVAFVAFCCIAAWKRAGSTPGFRLTPPTTPSSRERPTCWSTTARCTFTLTIVRRCGCGGGGGARKVFSAVSLR